jgi:hypothetical protein
MDQANAVGDEDMPPILGGPNSENAEFVRVIFKSDPELYKERRFRETVRDYQDILQTGGINTRMFRLPKPIGKVEGTEEIHLSVNSRDDAEKVVRFFEDQPKHVVSAEISTPRPKESSRNEGRKLRGMAEPRRVLREKGPQLKRKNIDPRGSRVKQQQQKMGVPQRPQAARPKGGPGMKTDL